MYKICSKCSIEKDISSFHKDMSHRDHHRDNCKSCKKASDALTWRSYREKYIARNKLYKHKNINRVRAQSAEYKSKHREASILAKARKRSRDTGLPFDLTIDDIIIPEFCPLIGIKLSFSGKMNNRDTSPSVDRIDSSRGYVRGNVKIISYRANRIKNDATIQELKMIGERIDSYAYGSDASDFVKEITFQSVKSEQEKTVIEIEEYLKD